MMTTRILPREEYAKLNGTLLDPAWRSLPSDAQVVAIEQDGALIGCSALFPAWHLEGVWIAPEYRKRVSVGRRLLRAWRALLAGLRTPEVLVMATNPESARLVFGLGSAVHLDCDHYAVTLRG